VRSVLEGINQIQKTSEIKLNTFYTIARLYARNNMNNILEKHLLLPISKPIPADSIVHKFDNYFRANLLEYYDELTNSGQEIFIPTFTVHESDRNEIYDCILMFFRNETNLD
jgi:hypothetical protein